MSKTSGFGDSQEQAIRTVAEEQAQDQHGTTAAQLQQHQQMGKQESDELDRELADAEIAGDGGEFDDEDMLDKMSSSPSIADGRSPSALPGERTLIRSRGYRLRDGVCATSL